jgi:hypothetical protein
MCPVLLDSLLHHFEALARNFNVSVLPTYTARNSSQPSVKAAECARKHERHGQDACSKRKYVTNLAQFEAPNAAHKQITDCEIEEAPQHIHRRRRQSHPGRSGEWTLEGMPETPFPKWGSEFAKKAPPKKYAKS